MWSDVNNSKSQGWLPGRATWGPLFLTVSPPIAAQVMALAQTRYDGSFTELYHAFMIDNTAVLQQLLTWPSMEAVKMLAVFMIAQAGLMRVLPGKRTEGPVSPTGHVPVYKDNGMLSFVVAVLGFVGLSDVVLGEQGFYKLSVLADNYFDSICALNVFSLLFCLVLLIKGHVAPSSTDNGSSGSLVTDFYWGMELYPRIFGWDVKQFTNCRFGMMWWTLFPISCAAYNYNKFGMLSNGIVVNCVLNLVYCAKFFLWEMGYMKSLDIMHDRAGFYICWGCLVWIPSLYMTHSYFLAEHMPELSNGLAAAILLVGFAAITINYDADRQRQVVRAADGNYQLWGAPAKVIRAKYRTSEGEERRSVLLVSGWWAVARHFHYVPEILGALCWSAPALFTHLMPYLYVSFLTVLLIDRAYRDDKRCSEKYGKYWTEYCAAVPYKIVPGLV